MIALLLSLIIACTPTACVVTWERAPGGVAQVAVSYEDAPGCIVTTSAAAGVCRLPSRPGEEIAVTLRSGIVASGGAATWERQTVRPRYQVWLPSVATP